MKIRDGISLVIALVFFGVALHAAFGAPRWWRSRAPVSNGLALPPVRTATEHELPAPVHWDESARTRDWFTSASRRSLPGPDGEVAAGAASTVMDAAPPPEPPRPRFELIGCAETSRGWAALVRDRVTAETALLCPGDIEPRWRAQLIALDRAAAWQPARIEVRELHDDRAADPATLPEAAAATQRPATLSPTEIREGAL